MLAGWRLQHHWNLEHQLTERRHWYQMLLELLRGHLVHKASVVLVCKRKLR